MTVGELKEILATVPDSAHVVIDPDDGWFVATEGARFIDDEKHGQILMIEESHRYKVKPK